MESEIREACDIPGDAHRAVVTRIILESITAALAAGVDELGVFLGGRAEELLVIGGGVRMGLMNRLSAEHTGLPCASAQPKRPRWERHGPGRRSGPLPRPR